MSDTKRLSERNAAIQAMLSSAEGIKDFYRFTAQNPHISLHDACQIVIQRPKASVCYSFTEWNNKRRYINRGSKGIAYYDSNGNKCHVFDVRDTHAEQAFTRESEPIGKVLQEMDALNGTELFSYTHRDYAALCDGVAYWLHENGYLQDNAEENTLLAEGVSYSLWCSTDAAQEDDEIQMHGLPYDLQDNADFCKNVYALTAVLQREAAEAYVAALSLPKEVDDTDEETVSDEPEFSAVPQEKQEEEKPQTSEQYKAYLAAQEKYPQAVVVQRLGDFYEIIGENATTIGNELDVTVTSRRVGLPERIPMVGFPYHAADKYIEKMLERHSVVVLEEKQEPKYILSHAESLTQNEERENQKSAEQAPTYAEENEDYIDDEEYYTDEFSDEENDDDVYYDYTEEDEESNGVDAEYEDEEERPKADNTPSNGVSKLKKGIQDRKRKESPQLSFFTALEPTKEKSRKEEMIERQLKRGSSFEHGKYRIMDMYRTNPTTKEFANLLKNEYGTGGYGGWGGDNQDHDSRGIEMKLRDEKGEVLEQATLKWTEVAERIADMIAVGDYLTVDEEKKYNVICARREERKNAKSDEEKIQVIVRQAVEIGTQKTRDGKCEIQPHMFEESAQFCRDHGAELSAVLSQAKEVKEIYRTEFPYQDNISVEFYPQYCERLKDNIADEEGSEEESVTTTPKESRAVKENTFNRFKNLTAEDKAFFDSFTARHMREPAQSLWDEVQQCRTIANGIYEVSTAGHGGIMIAQELAPHIFSSEALQEGVLDGGFYCYEEDSAACIPLRELWDKGILTKANEYFTHFYVNSRRPEAKNGRVPFTDATDVEKEEYFKWWNNAIDESLEDWSEKYWQTYRQADTSVFTGLSSEQLSEQERIKALTDYMIETGTSEAEEGYKTFYLDDLPETEEFIRQHIEDIRDEIYASDKAIEVDVDLEKDKTIGINFYLNYCTNLTDETKQEFYGNNENTDLNEIGFDQSALGGAKTRYKGNIAAIRLVEHLERAERAPTQEEKKTLASYVGWGGIAQVFDADNEQWRNEYNELKDLLSPKDYENAKGSVLNAHFTDKAVIDGIYAALKRLGVGEDSQKVKVLEPAMGTGNFFGFMPREIADNAKLYGVELDNITGRIAKQLYPQADIQIKGFEDTTFSDSSFDVVVGNVPFGSYSVYDKDYARQSMYIHDYFIAKSVDKLKPGGVLAVVTSSGTLDKQNTTARKYIADRAELIGAIRLPNTAFKQTANTEVVADILLLQKRVVPINATEENVPWLATQKIEHGTSINSYFVNHPEMVLGDFAFEMGMYGAPNMTVKPDGRELSDVLNTAVLNLPQNIFFSATTEEADSQNEKNQDERIEVDYHVKSLCYKAENGKLYMRVGDRMEEQEIPKSPKDAYYRIKEMIALREELHRILDIQSEGCSNEELTRAQWRLNARYDTFVERYGILNSKTNSKLFKDDGDSALLFACENLSEDKKSATKADVFRKRTIQPYTVPTSTDDCMEALQISKNERGKVDIAYIQELTQKDFDAVLAELGNAVFRNPATMRPEDKYSGYESADEYLSGDVVTKLQLAKLGADQFPNFGFERNVAALTESQPQKLTASEISVRISASWVDADYYKQFLCELLDIRSYYAEGLRLFRNPFDSSWRVDTTATLRAATEMKATEVYGTKRASAFRLFEDALNLRDTTIYDTIQENGKDKQVVNQAETIAAREKQNQIREEFKSWIFADPARREHLERIYNATFNRIKLPTYDGSYLRFPGMNPTIELRPHQKDAVHRIVTDGNALLHHVVGSGKTYTICAAIMKLKQYGLAKKPMIAVPNHLVGQWASEFRKLYPKANILVANKEDLEKENRKKFVSRVAMGDWDAVIIAQSSFAKINVSKERQIRKVQEEILNVERSIETQKEDKNASRGSIKNLEQIKKNREAQLKELTDDTKKDNVLIFEDLGVDYLFVDEAHYYKNLFLFTKMNNVAGISKAASKRASDLQMKCEYINELHGGDKGVVFATGTPISNSMTEMYTMQKYLQPSELKEMGIEFFDGWAADFGETVTALEMAPSGKGYRPRTRFCKFTNLPELMKHYRRFADVQTADMVKLNVPDAEHITVTLKPSDTTIELAEEIADRAQRIYDGGVNSSVDNMLKVTSDGKKLALDPRCFVPTSADEEGSKINACALRVYEIWKDTQAKKCTQLVFCDMSTPKKTFDDYVYGEDFDAYNELKYKLVQMGIPKEEIAFIHDANSDKSKQALFDSVNSGKVRVLIGSTEKCGAGTNVQKRLIALHHLDTPYRPSDLNQREGRIIRQGNENKAVKIFTYVTERTFDSYSYQILENKQRFISQIDRGDLTVREAEDIDETTLSYAEIKAITAANPRIKQKMEVDAEVSRLRVLEGQYRKNLYALQDKVRKEFPSEIQRCEQKIQRAQEDLLTIKACRPEDAEQFSILICGKRYTDKKEGGKALMDALFESKPGTVVAEYCGLKIALEPVHIFGGERSVSLSGTGQYSMHIGESTSGNLTRLDNFLDDFPALIERAKQRKAQLQADLKVAEEQVQKPFEHKERLDALLCEQSELNTELDIGQKQEIVVADETQEEGPQATLDSDDDLYMALPPKGSVRSTHRRGQQRKPVDGHLLRAYNKEQKETPDAYVFVHNGNSYDIIGASAERFAKENNLPISTEQYNGKKLAVVSLPFAALDEHLIKLTQAGEQVKIIEEIEQRREEEDMIDREDKTAQMQVPVLPDYTIGQDDMHDAGYTWDGMLPLRKRMAKLLVKLGLPVVVLKGDDTDKKITTIDEVEQGGSFFGIEKPDWNAFIASDKGRAYLSARLLLCQSMKHLTIEEMSYFDAQFVDGLIDSNYAERVALEKCLRETEKPETGAIKSYIQELLEDYTARFGNLPLKEYGWELYNVRNYLAEFIPDEEISKYAQELVNEQRLHNEIDWKLKQIVWLNGKTEGFDKEVISDIVNDLKPSFEYSFFNKSGKDDYDEWYDEFAEETLTPYLESKAAESSSEDMRLEQRVKASVDAEYKAFYAEESKKTPEELISKDNYKIRFFNELSVFLGEDIEDNLYDRDLQALLEDSPHILDSLYDFFLGNEYASINNYADVKKLIEAYNDKYHEEIVADRYSWNEGDFDSNVGFYYGKDTSNTAYYYLPSLSYDTLPEIKEKADSYVVAAPVSYLSDDIKDKYNIFFLQTDRDIAESELKDNAAAIGNMQSAVHRVVKARREEYYTVKKDTVNGKVEYTPVYLDANAGEIGTLFKRSFDTEKEIDELIAKVNTATDVPRDYVLVYVTPEELARKSEEIKKYTTAQTLQGKFLNETKDGYKVVNITKDKDERNIAIIYRQTANDFILAPRYDTSDGTWAQSYYYNSLESAEQDRAKIYGDKAKIYENKEWDKMPETKQQAEENMEQKKQAAKLKATVSRSAVIRLYNDRVFMRMPNTVEKYRGCTYNLRNHQFVMSKDESDNEVVKISLPEDFYVRLNDAKGGKAEISAAEFTALVSGTTEEDYARIADNGWHYASVPATGKIMALENSILFRMPKGEYERYAYTIPSPFIRYNEERNSYAIGIPEDFTVSMKDNKSNDTVTMTAESFIAEIKGKTENDYESAYRRPSEESKKRFAAVEERLRQVVPEEMKTRPNWVVVRTQENKDTGRLDQFMIDVHTGKSAQADDPNTWTDLDTACEYARENGGVALGYALDGNDQVACIDIDKCFAENGDMTPLAAEVFKKGNGTYAEKSVSGNSLHVFGKTDGMNLRAFGKDGDLAFYRKSHFVAMTGDNYGSSELKSLDTPDMKALLERKCEKRKEWNGVGKGVEGLSAMGDRDVVEKACSAAKGDVFVALYRGEDLQNNRNSSDMSFMNRLAFWCNGDKEQMLRIFATSVLYRPDKSPDYYENAAIKAVQDTVDRYQPKDKPSDKPSTNKPNGNGSGKR